MFISRAPRLCCRISESTPAANSLETPSSMTWSQSCLSTDVCMPGTIHRGERMARGWLPCERLVGEALMPPRCSFTQILVGAHSSTALPAHSRSGIPVGDAHRAGQRRPVGSNLHQQNRAPRSDPPSCLLGHECMACVQIKCYDRNMDEYCSSNMWWPWCGLGMQLHGKTCVTSAMEAHSKLAFWAATMRSGFVGMQRAWHALSSLQFPPGSRSFTSRCMTWPHPSTVPSDSHSEEGCMIQAGSQLVHKAQCFA